MQKVLQTQGDCTADKISKVERQVFQLLKDFITSFLAYLLAIIIIKGVTVIFNFISNRKNNVKSSPKENK